MHTSFAPKLSRDEYEELRRHSTAITGQDDCGDPEVAYQLSRRGLLVRYEARIKTSFYSVLKYSYRISRRGELMLKRCRAQEA